MKNRQSSGDLEGFLDKGTSFQGEVTFHDTLRIDGKFEGAIRAGKTLFIGEGADVNAEIDVAVVSVSGRLRGNVRASERIELHQTAKVECNLDCNVLVVEEGALFEGQCAMSSRSPKPRPADATMKTLASSK